MADEKYQYVKLPDGSYGKFPASASDDQIRTVLASQFPQEFASAKAGTPNYGDFARNLAARSAPKVPIPPGLQGPPSTIRNLSEQTHGALVEGAKDVGRLGLGIARMGGYIANPNAFAEDVAFPIAQTAMTSGLRNAAGQALGVDTESIQKASAEKNYPLLAEKTIMPIATILAGGKVFREASGPNILPKSMAVEAITDAVNPVAKDMPGFRANLHPNLDFAAQFAKAKGLQIVDRPSLASAMDGASQELRQFFKENYLNPTADVEVKVPRLYSGDTVPSPSAVEKMATVQQLYNRLGTINDTLYPKYQKGSGVAISASLGAENTAALNAEAAVIRQTLYKAIGDNLGIDPSKVAETNARSGSLRRQAEEVQLSADKERHTMNAAQQEPWSLDTTIMGAAARATRGPIRSMFGNPADRAIRNTFQSLASSDIARPTGTILDYPGATSPTIPNWRRAGTSPTRNALFFTSEPSESAQAAQRGSLNYRINENSLRLREALQEQKFNQENSRSARAEGRWRR